jgi:2-polyprenyl-3-methyl-5-hydroxy-6-metoxy-1,4-benzoquinol methylase
MKDNRDDLLAKLTRQFGKDSKLLFRVIRGKDYYQSIQDLVAYTGLSFDEVCRRVALKAGDRWHFTDEFAWENPGSPNELNWFYRACRGYLYGNASRPAWDALDFLVPAQDSPVLDYGGGIGQNSLRLAERGFDAWYFDISVLQADFVRFRAQARKLTVNIILPVYNGRFNYLDPIGKGWRAIVLQDVLEHIPRYPLVLADLVGKLVPSGVIVEYSPFNGKPHGKKMPKRSPLHIAEATPLDKVMAELGMAKTNLGVFPATVWRKEGGG